QSLLQLRPLEAFFWPPGYPLLVALVSLLMGQTPLAGQLVSVVMGGLVPACTVLLARELFPQERLLGLWAGLAVALCGQLWQSSIVVMADTTGLALATFSAFAVVRYAGARRLAWLVLASAALSWAVLARWIYGLVAIPLAAYTLWALASFDVRRTTTHLLAAAAVMAFILLPVLGPPLVGLVSHPAEPAAFAGNLQVYSWSPLNAFQRDFITADGHLSYAQRNGVYYALAPANPAFFGPFLAPWALLGLWAACTTWRRSTLVLVVGWAAIVYAFHAGAAWQNFRFTLAYLPPLALLVGAGLTWLWQRLRDRRVRLLVGFVAAVGFATGLVGAIRVVEGFVDRKGDDLALVNWVDEHTQPGARVLSFGPTLTLQHYSSRLTVDLFDVSAMTLTALLAVPGPDYVLVDETNLAEQWVGRAPAENVALLRREAGLTALGTYGAYTLFVVGAG
ncbi:MAG TPA: glycosyltransferase family 39 protein, partial [Chloroflexota bacterium]|nr:glycosyltransferase family 39 protein [Chloroflexota bacterium]